jgi:Nif-specific ferredoxin III
MQGYITGVTQGGERWIPNFIASLQDKKCVGCGRCYKVCGRNVFFMRELDDEDDSRVGVMEILNGSNCIGCEACLRVCVNKCQQFSPKISG